MSSATVPDVIEEIASDLPITTACLSCSSTKRSEKFKKLKEDYKVKKQQMKEQEAVTHKEQVEKRKADRKLEKEKAKAAKAAEQPKKSSAKRKAIDGGLQEAALKSHSLALEKPRSEPVSVRVVPTNPEYKMENNKLRVSGICPECKNKVSSYVKHTDVPHKELEKLGLSHDKIEEEKKARSAAKKAKRQAKRQKKAAAEAPAAVAVEDEKKAE